jgi:hypothetical protein
MLPALALLWMVSLTACIGEDMSMCPVEANLTLEFRFEASTRSLTDQISSVDVLVFDHERRFVDSRRLEKDELAASPQARFTLWPGDYLVTAWANVASSSRLSPLEKYKTQLEDGFIEMTGAGDSIYYAPARENLYTTREAALRAGEEESEEGTDSDPYALHRIQVPRGGGRVVKELPFVRAYRSVNIYVKGVENLYALNSAIQPVSVEARNLAARYDLVFNSQPSFRRNHTRLCSETFTPLGWMQAARLFMAYAPITNDIAFHLGNLPQDAPTLPILLAEYLREHAVANLDDIDIMVEFSAPKPGSLTGVRVSITAPDWESRPVKPEYKSPLTHNAL